MKRLPAYLRINATADRLTRWSSHTHTHTQAERWKEGAHEVTVAMPERATGGTCETDTRHLSLSHFTHRHDTRGVRSSIIFAEHESSAAAALYIVLMCVCHCVALASLYFGLCVRIRFGEQNTRDGVHERTYHACCLVVSVNCNRAHPHLGFRPLLPPFRSPPSPTSPTSAPSSGGRRHAGFVFVFAWFRSHSACADNNAQFCTHICVCEQC